MYNQKKRRINMKILLTMEAALEVGFKEIHYVTTIKVE